MINNAVFSLEEVESIKNTKSEKLKALAEKVIASPDGIRELAFAYYYTGDEKYWESAHEQIINKINTGRWENHDFGSSDLGTASECIFMANAYSLFGDKLTAEEKAEVAEHAYKRGI